MIRYSWWHLARILRRIIARKKRSQYCHVIKERFRESTWIVCKRSYLVPHVRWDKRSYWKIIGNLQISKALRYIECNRKFCRFTGFVAIARRISSVSFDSLHVCFENSNTYKRMNIQNHNLIVHLWQTGKKEKEHYINSSPLPFRKIFFHK